jgi:general secretion pathway protein M
MMDALKSWWQGLSARERVMLSVMAAVLVAVFLWLGVWRPGVKARGDAATRLEAMVSARERVVGQAAWLSSHPSVEGSPSVAPVDLIANAAQATGFELVRNVAEADGRVSIEIASARTPALLQWLRAIEKQGLVADSGQMIPRSDGTLGVTLTLKRAQ